MCSDAIIEKEELSRILFGLAVEAEKQLFDVSEKQGKRVIVLAGPTGVGKTELALMLAKTLGGEVVSADSMQVYRGMDIGTAKASEQQRVAVTHHLLDVHEVTEPFNVVDYYHEACHCVQTILLQNRVPIIAGGSGFYIHSLLYGPPNGPPSVPEVRQKLQKELEELGAEALYGRLKKLDPQYAKTVTCGDKQKIVRALEIITLTDRPVSSLRWKDHIRPLNYDFRCWFIYRPKDILYQRIDERCDGMLAAGFLDEVKALEELGIRENLSAAQAIGYRQALDYLGTEQTKEDYEAFVRVFKKASRRYAKRQFTWFRKEPLFRWLDIELHDPEIAVDMIISEYNNPCA